MNKFVVHQLLNHVLIMHPEQLIVSGKHRFTYTEFNLRVLKLANGLKKIGIKKGTMVGVLDVNSHRFLEMHYALSMLGAIIHTINFRLSPEQMVYSMMHAGDEWIFVSDIFAPAVKPLWAKFPNWVLMSDNNTQTLLETKQAFHYEDLINNSEAKPLPEADEVQEDDIFSIFYTTGTTGEPKGIPYEHKTILTGAIQLFHHMALHENGASLSSRDVFMPLIPFFHIHAWGMAFFPFYLGVKLVLPLAADAAEQQALIEKEKITWLNMVPTQLQALLEQKDFGNIKVLTGGSPFTSGIAHRATKAGVKFSLIYGGSDQLGTAISVVPESINPDSPEALEWLRVGMRPFPLVEVSIRDKQGKEVPHDGSTLGSVWVRSPWLPKGYYKNSEITNQHYINGWFRTGDLGFFHPNHLIYIADREGDAIKSGGEWIPTGLLESIISEHPAVAQVAVIPHKSEQWGQRPLAIIKKKSQINDNDLVVFLMQKVEEGQMAKFWVPDYFIYMDEIPLTSAGKLNKKILRDQYSQF